MNRYEKRIRLIEMSEQWHKNTIYCPILLAIAFVLFSLAVVLVHWFFYFGLIVCCLVQYEWHIHCLYKQLEIQRQLDKLR